MPEPLPPSARLLRRRENHDDDARVAEEEEEEEEDGRVLGPDDLHFTHGVASGDPMEDSVILWTRVSPVKDNVVADVDVLGLGVKVKDWKSRGRGKMGDKSLDDDDDDDDNSDGEDGGGGAIACVEYRVSEDEGLMKEEEEEEDVSVAGRAYTSADTDWTVKVRFFYNINYCLEGEEEEEKGEREKTVL